jgi:hypothetical protein
VLSRIRLGFLALATALAVLLGLPSPGHAARAGTPKVGQCHQLGYRQALDVSDDKAPVPCSRRHDLQTIAVMTSPTSLAGLSAEQLNAATDVCIPAFLEAEGRPLTRGATTAYDLWTYVPTAAQRAAGARWIRCDVALWRGAGLAPLPRHRLPRHIVPAHIDDRVRACLTKQRWTTTCDQTHSYRVMKSFEIHQAAYPTREQFIAAAQRRCPAGWSEVFWTRETVWSYGKHTVTCYRRTRA